MISRPPITIISDEVSQDIPEIARFVRDFNLPGIELRSIFGRAFKDLSKSDVASIATTARNEGWRLFGCATPVFKCGLDDDAAIREHVEIFRRSLDVASELGCDLLRVFTFLRLSTRGENLAAMPRVAEHLHHLSEIAKGTSVRIGIENELSCIVATTEELAALFPRLPEPHIGIVWDPCNIVYVPDEPFPVTSGFAQVADRILHVHIKDAIRRPPSRNPLHAAAVPVGLGDVNWRRHLPEILRSGYTGAFSLETHWRVKEIDESELHLPAGYPFSYGGDEASRVCLRNLNAILDLAAPVAPGN